MKQYKINVMISISTLKPINKQLRVRTSSGFVSQLNKIVRKELKENDLYTSDTPGGCGFCGHKKIKPGNFSIGWQSWWDAGVLYYPDVNNEFNYQVIGEIKIEYPDNWNEWGIFD